MLKWPRLVSSANVLISRALSSVKYSFLVSLPDLMVAEEFAATVQQRFVLRVGRVQRTFDQHGLRDRRGRHVEIHGHEIHGG